MKANQCFVDTSAFIALNNPSDQYYQKAIEIAENLGNHQYILSEAVLTETYTLLRYKLGYHVAIRFLYNVTKEDSFKITDVTFQIRKETLELLEQFNDHKISYCDALSVAIMRKHKIENIFSFDHHFDLMGIKMLFVT